ncbi:hypothetical protein ScPMuIL_007858 [Solemya velum]
MKRKKGERFPGPNGLPLVGNFLDFKGKNKVEVIQKYRQKYGDIFELRFLHKSIIVLSGYSTLKDALVKNRHVFSDRPFVEIKRLFLGSIGIVTNSGPDYRELKYFTMCALKDFGLGKTGGAGLEGRIQDECACLVAEIEKKNGQPFNISTLLHKTVANTIGLLLFSHRYQYDDERFTSVVHSIINLFKNTSLFSVLSFVPILRTIIPKSMSSVKQIEDGANKIAQFLRDEIETHAKTFDETELRDFTDAFLKEMKLHKDEPKSVFTADQLLTIQRDFLMGGTETTASTILWGVILLTRNPKVCSIVRQELHDNIEEDGIPSYYQLKELPFTEATLCEIQRLADVGPLGVIHATSSDTNFHGYDIPKGTAILTNLHSVMHDEALWGDPLVFRPDRFLDESGRICRAKTDKVIAFSVGQRACPGESLARLEVFGIITGLVRKFTFLPPDGESPPSLDANYGVSRTPASFRIRFVPRTSKQQQTLLYGRDSMSSEDVKCI